MIFSLDFVHPSYSKNWSLLSRQVLFVCPLRDHSIPKGNQLCKFIQYFHVGHYHRFCQILCKESLMVLQWKNEYHYSFAHDRHLSSRLFSCSMQCSVSKIHLITKNAHSWSCIDMDFQPMSLKRSKLRAKPTLYWLCPRWKDVVPLAACWFR